MKSVVWFIILLISINLDAKTLNSDEKNDSISFEYWYNEYNKYFNSNQKESSRIATYVVDSINKYNLKIEKYEYSYVATFYFDIGKLEIAFDYFAKAIDYAKEINDTTSLSYLYVSMAGTQHFMGLFVKCIENAKIAYEHAEKNNSVHEMIIALNLMSDSFNWLRDRESAKEYLIRAIELADKHNLENYKPDLYRHLGFHYNSEGNNEEALRLHLEAEEIAKKHNVNNILPFLQFAIGIDYYALEDFDKALEYMLNAYDQFMAMDNKLEIPRLASSITDAYTRLKDYEKAKEYAYVKLKYAKMLNSKNEIANAYYNIARTNYYLKNYSKGLEFLKKHVEILRELEQEEIDKELSEIQASFDLDFKNRESEILKKENEIEQLKLQRLNTLIIGLVIFLLLLVTITAILIKRATLKTKQKISKYTQQNLRFQMNPHFIFNTLNSIQYILFKKDRKESNLYLTKFGRLLNMVIHNSKKEMVYINEELDVLNLYLELEKLRFKEKLNYQINLDENIDKFEHKIPAMLMQPFIENSIIHGIMPKNDPGTVNINLKLINDKIVCEIIDDGIGRKKAGEIKQSQVIKTRSLGTKITESRLELINVIYQDKLDIKYIDLYNEEKEAVGTKVELTFPIILN